MKKVFSNSELPHVWAHQQQDEATTTGRNFYFKAATIYSYGSHFPIASHVTNEQGQKAILFTTRNYSNSTAKHIGKTWAAIPDRSSIILCNTPCGYWGGAPDKTTHTGNLNNWLERVNKELDKLATARKPETYIGNIEGYKQQVDRYCTFFSLDIPAALLTAFEVLEATDTKNLLSDRKEAIQAAKKKEKERMAARIAEDIASFKSFESRGVYYGKSDLSYLRYNTDKKRVETSRGIEIPVEIAKRAYIWLMDIVEKGGCVECCDYKILNYTVNYVNKNTFKIGCHIIPISEAKEIAKQLNW